MFRLLDRPRVTHWHNARNPRMQVGESAKYVPVKVTALASPVLLERMTDLIQVLRVASYYHNTWYLLYCYQHRVICE
jgi:hypothetical protein